jgi:hypothetical protein
VADAPESDAPLLDKGPLVMAGIAAGLAASVTTTFLVPVVAITLGVLFRGEHLTWRLLVGAVIVVAAVATVVRKEPATAPPPDEGVPCAEEDDALVTRHAA